MFEESFTGLDTTDFGTRIETGIGGEVSLTNEKDPGGTDSEGAVEVGMEGMGSDDKKDRDGAGTKLGDPLERVEEPGIRTSIPERISVESGELCAEE